MGQYSQIQIFVAHKACNSMHIIHRLSFSRSNYRSIQNGTFKLNPFRKSCSIACIQTEIFHQNQLKLQLQKLKASYCYHLQWICYFRIFEVQNVCYFLFSPFIHLFAKDGLYVSEGMLKIPTILCANRACDLKTFKQFWHLQLQWPKYYRIYLHSFRNDVAHCKGHCQSWCIFNENIYNSHENGRASVHWCNGTTTANNLN